MPKISIKKASFAPAHLGSFRTLGIYLGYPACCIDAFVKFKHFKEDVSNWPLIGTGFVPCKRCAEKKSARMLADEINRLRVHPVPFPDEKEVDLTQWEAKWLCREFAKGEDRHPRLKPEDIAQIESELKCYRKHLTNRKEARQIRLDNRRNLPIKVLVALSKAKKRFKLGDEYHVAVIPLKYWDLFEIDLPMVSWRRKDNQIVYAEIDVFEIINKWFEVSGVPYQIDTNAILNKPAPY